MELNRREEPHEGENGWNVVIAVSSHEKAPFSGLRTHEFECIHLQVKNIAEMGAYVALLEYNNIEGMILLSELSRRRIRSISSLIKVGRQEPVMVLRVDKEKGYIDLSKRRVSEEDVAACEERYNKSKLVHSIMRHVAETMEADVEVNLQDTIYVGLYNLYSTH